MYQELSPQGNPNEIGGLQRVVPADIFAASHFSLKGQFVDVTPLIPVTEKEGSEFQTKVQKAFDRVATDVSSPEYAQFKQQTNELLAGVKNQQFLFDIEATVLGEVVNSTRTERVYVINPWMRGVVGTLINNGNQVGFWTSANDEQLGEMKKAMSPEMAELPAITSQGYMEVARAFRERQLNKAIDEEVLETMQKVYPTANRETFQAGMSIFTKEKVEDSDFDNVWFRSKYPQLFLSPANGFFIDDNSPFINSAISAGWPENRAIKCGYFGAENYSRTNFKAHQDAVEVVEGIASATQHPQGS